MSYKNWINSHFSGCRLLAEGRDLHRQRQVKIHMLPGEFQNVGVTDGTDAWIAPARESLFSINVVAILQKIREGQDVPVQRDPFPGSPAPSGRRRLITSEEVPPVPTRRRLSV